MRVQVAGILAASILAGCRPQEAPSSPPAPKGVGVIRPEVRDVVRGFSQPATLQGIEEAVLYSRAAGYLKSITVDKGDRVRAGQLLAVVESPELAEYTRQAAAGLEETRADRAGAAAGADRSRVDVAQAGAEVEPQKAAALEAGERLKASRADLARAEADLRRLEARLDEARADVEASREATAQGAAEVARAEQQVRALRSTEQAVAAAVSRAEGDFRLHQLTYQRLKAIQDRDRGLVAAQDVDTAQARMEAGRSDLEVARRRRESAGQDVLAAEQQIEVAKRGTAVSGRKVEAALGRLRAAEAEIQVCRQHIEAARHQVSVSEARVAGARGAVAVSQMKLKAQQEQTRVARSALAAAQARVEGRRRALAAASVMGGFTRIVAPFDGVVVERLMDPGALVQNASTNQAAARGILRLARDDRLRVLIPLPEVELAHARKGVGATIVTAAYPNDPVRGKVLRVAGAVDVRSRTVATEIVIDNPHKKLRPGSYARVTLALETHRSAVTLPTEALLGKDPDRFVYVIERGKVRKQAVKVGVDDGKVAEITQGLSAEDDVALQGKESLTEGMAVTTRPAVR